MFLFCLCFVFGWGEMKRMELRDGSEGHRRKGNW